MTNEQAKALKAVCDAIIEAVRAAGDLTGAPGGHLYAAMMAQGCSLRTFEALMNALVSAGKLKRRGQCYFIA